MSKYEVGKVYEVVKNTTRHQFKIGEEVRVTATEENHGTVEIVCEHLDGSDWWWLHEEELKTPSIKEIKVYAVVNIELGDVFRIYENYSTAKAQVTRKNNMHYNDTAPFTVVECMGELNKDEQVGGKIHEIL